MRKLNSGKGFTASRIAGLRKRYATDPAFRAAKTKIIVEAARRPEERQRRSDRARSMGLSELGHAALQGNEQAHARRGRAVSQTRMRHIPSGYRQLYRDLIRKNKLPAAEALAAVHAQHEADLRRFFGGSRP